MFYRLHWILEYEDLVTQCMTEDLELGNSVVGETSPKKPKAPNNDINFNRSNNDINYMRFWLNSERMLHKPVENKPLMKQSKSKSRVIKSEKGAGKSKPTLKVQQARKIKTVKKSRAKKSQVKGHGEKFQQKVSLEKEVAYEEDTTQSNLSEDKKIMAQENLTNCTSMECKSKKLKSKTKKSKACARTEGNSKRKLPNISAPKIMDQRKYKQIPEDAECLAIPLLNFGWQREIVYRKSKDSVLDSKTADVYYRSPPPFNKKFRSKVEITDALQSREYRERFPSLTVSCFSFSRVNLGLGEPYEIERNAIRRGRIIPENPGVELKEGDGSELMDTGSFQESEQYSSSPLQMMNHAEWIGNLVF